MTFQSVLRSVGRVLWFAVAGALCMAVVGVVAGSVTGALYQYLDEITFGYKTNLQVLRVCKRGAVSGSIAAAFVGAIVGAVAFGAAGILSCLSAESWQVFKASTRLAACAALLTMTICLVLSSLNFYLWTWLKGETLFFPRNNYLYIVVISFILGTFYGAVVGARREITRQKSAPLHVGNGAL